MKASYKLQLEQEQRRLGLSHKQLNKYDRKHNDINLIKYLQSLEPVASGPPQAPSPHWTGNLTFIRTAGSGTQFINLRTEAGTLANNVQYTGANSYLVTLQNPQNYLEVAFDWSGYWEIGSVSFPNIPSPYVYIENYLTWYRYTIPSGLGNLTYNFTTFFND